MQTRNGYGPPVYPTPKIGDPAVLRAIVGTAVFLALIALLSLALGTIFRRTAVSIDKPGCKGDPDGCPPHDTTAIMLSGVHFGQIAAIVLAVALMSAEFHPG